MKRFRSYPFLVLVPLGAALFLAACEGRQPPDYNGDPTAIPFELILPEGLARGDYYAIAGTKGEQQQSLVNDSIIELPVWRSYAEFYAEGGTPIDFNVLVNTTTLERHRGGDTLRLRSTFDTTIVRGEQTWKLREPGETTDLTRFTLPAVDLLGTIEPFERLRETKGTIRSDTALTIVWQPGTNAGTIKIEWRTAERTVAYSAQDFTGSYTIPAAVMANLRGAGTVIITRYRSITAPFNGKTIVGTRISQRTYSTTVQ